MPPGPGEWDLGWGRGEHLRGKKGAVIMFTAAFQLLSLYDAMKMLPVPDFRVSVTIQHI